MHEFKVGDRVKLETGEYYSMCGLKRGSLGTVVTISGYAEATQSIGVQFDKPFNGHTFSGLLKNNNGWYADFDEISKISEESAPSTTQAKVEHFLVARTAMGGRDLAHGVPNVQGAVVSEVVTSKDDYEYKTDIVLQLASGDTLKLRVIQDA